MYPHNFKTRYSVSCFLRHGFRSKVLIALDNCLIEQHTIYPICSGKPHGIVSSTIWPTASDLTDKVLYYHTQHDKRVRSLDLGALGFENHFKKITFLSLDEKKLQDGLDITPKLWVRKRSSVRSGSWRRRFRRMESIDDNTGRASSQREGSCS